MSNNQLILAIAATLDYLIGDPWGWPHPVRLMGWVIQNFQTFTAKYLHHPLAQRSAGIVLAIGLVTSSGIVGWLIIQTAQSLHPLLGIIIASILLASCFAGRSLRTAGEEVLQSLNQKDINTTRSILSRYVGRDTDRLTEPEILRAV